MGLHGGSSLDACRMKIHLDPISHVVGIDQAESATPLLGVLHQ